MRRALFPLIIIVGLLTACQAAPSASGNFTPFQAPAGLTPNPNRQAFGGFSRNRTPTVAPTPMLTDTPVPAPTAQSPESMAATVALDYFNAVQTGDFLGASRLVSAFSLRIAQMTRDDLVTTLAQQKPRWSNFQLINTQVLDNQTVLIHVTYQMTSKDVKTGKDVQSSLDEIWPLRQEVGSWMYNWGNVIDFRTLTVSAQTTAGVTIDPLQITRYSDHLSLTLLAQNNTNDAIAIGNANQVLATFHFSGKAVDADPGRIILDPLRSYNEVSITLKGLYTSFPDSVEIVRFKDLKVAPWFNFNLAG